MLNVSGRYEMWNLLSYDIKIRWMNEWMSEWMNEWQEAQEKTKYPSKLESAW